MHILTTSVCSLRHEFFKCINSSDVIAIKNCEKSRKTLIAQFHGIDFKIDFSLDLFCAIFGTLISSHTKRLAIIATRRLFLRHDLWHDVIMMSGYNNSGILLNIIIFLILVNPLLAGKIQSNRRERDRQRQQAQEERQSEFVKGKSKKSRPILYSSFCDSLILQIDLFALKHQQ